MPTDPVRERLRPLFAPESVAVVGASVRTGRPGFAFLDSLRRIGYTGAVHPVTPSYERVLEWDCLPSIEALPAAVDLVVLAGSGDRIEGELSAAIAAGARSALVVGRSEALDRVAALATDAGIPLLGPATMGYVNYSLGTSLTWMPPADTVPGTVAVIAQSGAVFLEANTSDPRLALSFSAHPGQAAVLDVPDLIEYVLADPGTRGLGLYLETISDAAALERALALAEARGVPVVAVRPGRSERSAAAIESHAGRLAGAHASFEAVFRRYGVAFASSMDEFWTTLACFSHPKRFAAGGVGALLDSGGGRAMMLDHAADLQVTLAELSVETQQRLAELLGPGLEPQNPVDMWDGHADVRSHATACLRILVADPSVSAAFVFCDWGATDFDPDPHARALADACLAVSAETTKPIYATSYSSRQLSSAVMLELAHGQVPTLDGMRMALAAAGAAQAHRDHRRREPPTMPTLPDLDLERDALDVLRELGLPTVAALRAESVTQAVAAAEGLGYPVVLKTGEAIAHKTEVDGVRLNLADADAVEAAYRGLASLGSRVVVSPQVEGGVEVALGVVRDTFGPMLMLAAGGTLIELLDDRRWLLAPCTGSEVRDALDELRIGRVLRGVRGRPPGDIDALCEIAARLSAIAVALGDRVVEIDINPVIVSPFGCTVVDALIVTCDPAEELDDREEHVRDG